MDIGLISGGASVLGTLGSIFSANKALKAQREENEKNRQFNAQQAALSRQYNTQMVNEQNLYNDPSNVMRRLQKAGINPALAYSNGGSVLGSVGIGSTSQQASSNSSVNPAMPDWSGIGQAGQSIMQTQLLKEQARKTAAEADQVEIDNVTRALQNQSNIKMTDALTFNYGTQSNVNEETAKNLVEDRKLIKQNVDKTIHETIGIMRKNSNLAKEGDLLDLDLAFKTETFGDMVSQVQSQAKCSRVEAEYAAKVAVANLFLTYANTSDANGRALVSAEQVKVLNKSLSKLQSEIDNNHELNFGMQLDNDMKQLDLAFKYTYGEKEAAKNAAPTNPVQAALTLNLSGETEGETNSTLVKLFNRRQMHYNKYK